MLGSFAISEDIVDLFYPVKAEIVYFIYDTPLKAKIACVDWYQLILEVNNTCYSSI